MSAKSGCKYSIRSLTGQQLQFQRILEDVRRIMKYKVEVKIEEVGDRAIQLALLDD